MKRPTIRIAGIRFELIPHPMTEQPEHRWQHVGYVLFVGSARLQAALWKGGQWVDHRKQPFEQTPDCWYSVEPA